MKIPETSANVGAYYGNEENGQWQPNGVIIDSGVGGGIVGSGDAGVRPPYPIHIPRSHIPGYVMAGAYYPAAYPAPAPPPPQDDFEDYMWMENEEEFDKQVMQQLEEEALMEQCIEAMLEDEQRERQRPHNGHHYPTTSNGPSLSLEETVSRSTLNPLAAEFVPSGRPPPSSDEKPECPPEASAAEVPKSEEEAPSATPPTEESKNNTEEPQAQTQPTEPPEVSAADVTPDKRPKDKKPEAKKTEANVKKAAKQEPKKKPLAVKSDTKVQPKKKEVKAVKSETKIDDKLEELISTETAKPQQSIEEPACTGPKPINYAAAAKANKPKKPTTPPIIDKTPPPELKKPTPPPETKSQVKTDKKPQRKNSTK